VAGGSTRGILPAASIPDGGQSIVSAIYTGNTVGPVVIDLDFILTDGTVLSTPGAITLSTTTRRRDVDISTLNRGLPRNQFFSVRYHVRSDVAPVSLGYTSIANGDSVSTSFQTASTETVFFGDGFTNPAATGSETISIYNPFMGAGVTFSYR